MFFFPPCFFAQFQSTPPRRRRLAEDQRTVNMNLFQSTPPRRRRRFKFFIASNHQNFNPRLREGGDFVGIPCKYLGTISIHASAKEATLNFKALLNRPGFQSTPPRRRRQVEGIGTNVDVLFQSTPPRRRRHKVFLFEKENKISIHASAKEATKE